MANPSTLPIATHDREGVDSKKILEEAGVTFGEVIPGKPLFQYVNLPDGWRMVNTGDPMHTKLFDEKGEVRANIFFNFSPLRYSASYSATV